MNENKMTNYSTASVMDFTISPFMRKGKYDINLFGLLMLIYTYSLHNNKM